MNENLTFCDSIPSEILLTSGTHRNPNH
ncbi:unnamed protein product, partial [Leptidea sinapis]